VSVLAYLTDYHLIPRRFTPGFELVFPRTLFPWLYAALAGSLVAGVGMQRRLDVVNLLAAETSHPQNKPN
jgi:hypothetical protein